LDEAKLKVNLADSKDVMALQQLSPIVYCSMRKDSKGLITFAILHHCFFVLTGLMCLTLFIALASQAGDAAIGTFLILCLLTTIPTTVFQSLILHRGWSFVQDGKAVTTPGKAVGFLFVPFYNFYWIFIAYYGLMKEFNRIAVARGKGPERVTTGLALTYSILSVIPYVSFIVAPFFQIVVMWQIISYIRENED
jgi:hypothetical protein